MPTSLSLAETVSRLAAPKRGERRTTGPELRDPFALVVWENVAYLVDDERRAETYRALEQAVGIDPEAILATPEAKLAKIIERGGMQPRHRASKVHAAARIALEIGLAKLRKAVKGSPAIAKKLLRSFPGIGEPGADKILLHARSLVTVAPDSNALRVLCRIGLGYEQTDYGKTYRLTTEALEPELPHDYAWLLKAHRALRRHGQDVCKTSKPRCDDCVLADRCHFGVERARSSAARSIPSAHGT